MDTEIVRFFAAPHAGSSAKASRMKVWCVMQGLRWVLVASVSVTSILSATHGSVVAGESDTPAARQAVAKAILDTWRQRQEATRELSFTWTSEDYELYSRRELIAGVKAAFGAGGAGNTQQIKESHEMSTSGGSVAYGQRDQVRFDFHSTVEGSDDSSEILSDGELLIFFPKTDQGYPKAAFHRGLEPSGWRYTAALPMRLIFRPFLPTAGFDGIETAQCTGSGLVFEEARCFVLSWENHEVWVSADDARFPVRYRQSRPDSGKSYLDIAIDYDVRRRELPVPEGWRITKFGIDGETILESNSVTLTEYELVKPPPPETFTIDFPPGTWVGNTTTRENYIVRDGLPNRIVRPGEFTGDNYDELLNSDMPITPQEIATKSTVNWIWIGNGLIIAFIVFLLYRRHVQT